MTHPIRNAIAAQKRHSPHRPHNTKHHAPTNSTTFAAVLVQRHSIGGLSVSPSCRRLVPLTCFDVCAYVGESSFCLLSENSPLNDECVRQRKGGHAASSDAQVLVRRRGVTALPTHPCVGQSPFVPQLLPGFLEASAAMRCLTYWNACWRKMGSPIGIPRVVRSVHHWLALTRMALTTRGVHVLCTLWRSKL